MKIKDIIPVAFALAIVWIWCYILWKPSVREIIHEFLIRIQNA